MSRKACDKFCRTISRHSYSACTYPVVGSICTAEKYTVTVAGDARSKRKLDFTLIIVHRTRTFSAVLLPQTVHGPAIPTVIRPLSPALTPCSRCPHYRAARIVTGTRKYDCGPIQLLLCHLHRPEFGRL